MAVTMMSPIRWVNASSAESVDASPSCASSAGKSINEITRSGTVENTSWFEAESIAFFPDMRVGKNQRVGYIERSCRAIGTGTAACGLYSSAIMNAFGRCLEVIDDADARRRLRLTATTPIPLRATGHAECVFKNYAV